MCFPINEQFETDTIRIVQSYVPHHRIDFDDSEFYDMMWRIDFLPTHLTNGYRIGCEYCDNSLKTVQFWQLFNQSWDLIISDEMFNAAGMAFGVIHNRLYNIPHVAFR